MPSAVSAGLLVCECLPVLLLDGAAGGAGMCHLHRACMVSGLVWCVALVAAALAVEVAVCHGSFVAYCWPYAVILVGVYTAVQHADKVPLLCPACSNSVLILLLLCVSNFRLCWACGRALMALLLIGSSSPTYLGQ
jgi:steroid 5-alpha reductase family enzyme